MKVSRNPHPDKFVPFELVFTIESKEEAQALYAIFNLVKNCDLLDYNVVDKIRDVIGKEYQTVKYNDVISRGITYKDYYKS